MTYFDRERFEVRLVDNEKRVYRYVCSDRKYHDACIAADKGRVWLRCDFVVLDAHEGHRILYDSRKLAPVR